MKINYKSYIDISAAKSKSPMPPFRSCRVIVGLLYCLAAVTTAAAMEVQSIEVKQDGYVLLIDGKSTIDFGYCTAGEDGLTRTFTITNRGEKPLRKLSIIKDGSRSADYKLRTLKVTMLAPGASTTFKITFHPKTIGLRKAAIHIRNGDSEIPSFDIKLNGVGTNEGPWRRPPGAPQLSQNAIMDRPAGRSS